MSTILSKEHIRQTCEKYQKEYIHLSEEEMLQSYIDGFVAVSREQEEKRRKQEAERQIPIEERLKTEDQRHAYKEKYLQEQEALEAERYKTTKERLEAEKKSLGAEKTMEELIQERVEERLHKRDSLILNLYSADLPIYTLVDLLESIDESFFL